MSWFCVLFVSTVVLYIPEQKNCLCFHAICLIDSVASNMLKIGGEVAAKKIVLGM